jgi:2-polyprenyl-6-methoxyphenol hydroxylase-like FAD-dependent oxidoreductase
MGAREKRQVVVIGGGPAGSTAGAILAQNGLEVVLLEREMFPRFHIGESLMTETYWTLERTGMLGRLKATDFPRKYSVQFDYTYRAIRCGGDGSCSRATLLASSTRFTRRAFSSP